MIVYKIDSPQYINANKEIRDMAQVLAEIPTTLQILKKYIAQQEYAISTPSIDNYRDELNRKIADAIELARTITDSSQRLVAVSDQAGKHLAAVEEHFDAALHNPSAQTQSAELVQA